MSPAPSGNSLPVNLDFAYCHTPKGVFIFIQFYRTFCNNDRMSMLWAKKLRGYSFVFADLLLLLLSFYTALTLAPIFRMPFKNPYDISNPFNPTGFNPENNFYSIVFIIFATIGIFYGLRWLYRSRFAWTIKVLAIGLLLVNYLLTQLIPTPGYTDANRTVDHFHAGEQLAAAKAYLSGTRLYDGMFFLRGAGVDAVLPALGLTLFGGSIGGFIVAMDVLEVLAILSFFVLLAFIIRNPLVYGLAITFAYISNIISLVHFRDIPVWIAFGLVLLAFRTGITNMQKRFILAGIGAVAGLSLYLSIDRGIMLLALAVLLAASLALIRAKADNTYVLDHKAWRQNIVASAFVLLGLVGGIVIPALFLGWDGFAAFIKMTFLEIPQYGGLLVSMPFPSLFSDQYLLWAPVFVAIAAGFLLVQLWRSGAKIQLNRLVPYTLLFVFAVICLKAGANRIHISKMASVTAPLFLIALLILIFAIWYAYKNPKARQFLILPIVLTAASILSFVQPDPSKLFYQPEYSRAMLADYKNWTRTPDERWISKDAEQVKNHILKNTGKGDYIFAFTADPMYYYLTGRKNPTRFNVSWFADPQPYTNEMLSDLKKNPPWLVIYKEGSWMDAPDTIKMEDRIPEVNEWIVKNYPTRTMVGNTIILSR